MLGLGQSLSHGGAPSEPPFKLVISGAKITQKPDDEAFTVKCKPNAATKTQIGMTSQGTYTQFSGLTGDVVLKRVSDDGGTVLASVTATGLNVYKAGNNSNVFFTDASGDSSQTALNSGDGADTLSMADSSVFDTDISTTALQYFVVDIILKGTGFEDSDSISSSSNPPTQVAESV
tara:strand:+ start:13 stop:540 length:528 start_codon:yes stop_codon:yes gene_type:complete